jgi:hypothetical protein
MDRGPDEDQSSKSPPLMDAEIRRSLPEVQVPCGRLDLRLLRALGRLIRYTTLANDVRMDLAVYFGTVSSISALFFKSEKIIPKFIRLSTM